MSSTTLSSERDLLVGALCGELSLKQVVERRPFGLFKRIKIFLCCRRYLCGVALVGA